MHITVFDKTLSYCPGCMATKRKLSELGLDFDVVSADTDDAVRDQLLARGFRQSPVVEVRDDAGELVRDWSGYRPDLLAPLAGKRS